MLPEYLSLISGSDYNVRKGKKRIRGVRKRCTLCKTPTNVSVFVRAGYKLLHDRERNTVALLKSIYFANKYSPSHKKRIHIIDTCLITPDRATDWVVHPDAW